MATPYGLTYGLAQLGSQAMPQYYAAQARDLESQKQQMGVEALREDMAAKRRAQEEAAALDEAMLNPETAAETLRGRGYGMAGMKAEQAFSQQQAQALKQQEDFERSEHKRKMRNFVQYSTKGQFGQAAETIGLDDFRVEGDKAYLTTQGQTVEVPYSVLIASMSGEPEDAVRAIEQYGKEVRREEVERVKAEQRKIESDRRYELGLKRIDAMMRRAGGAGSGGFTAMQKNQMALKKSFMQRGMQEPEADERAWSQVLGNTRWRAVASDIRIGNALLNAAKDSGDPAQIAEAERLLTDLFSGNQPNQTPTGGGKTPPPPPGAKISRR